MFEIGPENTAVIKILKKHPLTGGRDEYYRLYDFLIYCPHCKEVHYVVNSSLSGTTEKPSASPSIWAPCGDDKYACHFYLRGGAIRYLGDAYRMINGNKVRQDEDNVACIPVIEWNNQLKGKRAKLQDRIRNLIQRQIEKLPRTLMEALFYGRNT